MSNDTEEQKICDSAAIRDCPHFSYVDIGSPKVKKCSDYIHVGAQLPPQTVFHIQRIADQEFTKDDSEKAHPGNRAEAVRRLLEYGVDRYNSVKKRGTFREIMEGKYDDGGGMDVDQLEEKIEGLKEEKRRLKSALEEKREEIKDLKKDHAIVEGNSDLFLHIHDLIREEPLTLDKIVERLQNEKGLQFREYQHPGDPSKSIGLKGLTDYFLNKMLDANRLEVTREDGKTVYEAKR